jgi:cholest-4-en-3-one 26-monooxygenase
MRVLDADLADHELFARGVPHDLFDRLREEAPVSWALLPGGDGFWNLVTHRDIVFVSRHHELFSSARGVNIEDAHGGWELAMVNQDPPRHTRIRSLVSRGFHPRVVAAMEPHIRDIARRIVDDVIRRGECDFVVDVAARLPLAVIAEMIGVPREDHARIFDWSNRLLAGGAGADAEYGGTLEAAQQAALEMCAYWDELAARRRAAPGSDLASILVAAEVDGDRLTAMELDIFLLLLAVAGNETTRNLISGGTLALIEHPEQRERLLADRSLLGTAVQEMLRWVSPVMHFRRTVTREVEIRGQRLRAGEKVLMWYVAGNRDPEVFPDPHRFDVGRTPNEHLAFGGGGAHFCLGFSLAELEARIMFEEILDRMPDLRLAGPVARLASNFINGIKHMPVRFTPERP